MPGCAPCSTPRTTSRWSARPATATRPWPSRSHSGPTSCSWTSACPASTAWRRRAGSSPSRQLAEVKVVVLTTFEVDEYVFEALRAGRRGLPAQGRRPCRHRARGARRGRGRVAALAVGDTARDGDLRRRRGARRPRRQRARRAHRARGARSSRSSARGCPTARSPSAWSSAPPPRAPTSRARCSSSARATARSSSSSPTRPGSSRPVAGRRRPPAPRYAHCVAAEPRPPDDRTAGAPQHRGHERPRLRQQRPTTAASAGSAPSCIATVGASSWPGWPALAAVLALSPLLKRHLPGRLRHQGLGVRARCDRAHAALRRSNGRHGERRVEGLGGRAGAADPGSRAALPGRPSAWRASGAAGPIRVAPDRTIATTTLELDRRVWDMPDATGRGSSTWPGSAPAATG